MTIKPYLIWSTTYKKGIVRTDTLDHAREWKRTHTGTSDVLILWGDKEFTPWPDPAKAGPEERERWLLTPDAPSWAPTPPPTSGTPPSEPASAALTVAA